jgi:ribosomal protein RSM22 (predicted rRNA methylase)
VNVPVQLCRTAPPESDFNGAVVLISHVINELNSASLSALISNLAQAESVVWVEPGSFAESRRLIDAREQLRDILKVLAPCPHQGRCGMLKGENSHWCHHFAHPPVEAFTDSGWSRFARIMNIDLRSLPYSYLILQKEPATVPDGDCARVIGSPREYHGYLKVLSCEQEQVEERMLQKRDDKALYKTLRKARHFPLQRWQLKEGKIVGGEEPSCGNPGVTSP